MLRSFVMGLLALWLVACDANAEKYVEGKHYEVVAEKATAKPEVKEFFSFFCGGCYNFEPLANKISSNLPTGMTLEKVHVDFVGHASPALQNALARAYLVGKEAGKGEQVAGLIFNYIHLQRAGFSNTNDIRNLLLVNDFDAAVFDAKFDSLPIISAADHMKSQQQYWAEKKVINSVPTFLVNGRYKLKFDQLDKDNFEAELQELIKFLLAKDA